MISIIVATIIASRSVSSVAISLFCSWEVLLLIPFHHHDCLELPGGATRSHVFSSNQWKPTILVLVWECIVSVGLVWDFYSTPDRGQLGCLNHLNCLNQLSQFWVAMMPAHSHIRARRRSGRGKGALSSRQSRRTQEARLVDVEAAWTEGSEVTEGWGFWAWA